MNAQIQFEVSILIAALGGLAVGLERQWSGHATGPRARFAGIRTLTLLGGLSGLAGGLWMNGAQVFGAVLVGGAVAVTVAGYVAASRHDAEGTTEVAGLVVIGAGVAAGLGRWEIAGGVIAVTTLLLVEKSRIHEIAGRLDDTTLRAGVRFGVMAMVILPLLPAGPFGPWGGIRPQTLWFAVLMFSGLGFAGHVARLALRGWGFPLAGILGGLVSSTSVALTFSKLSRSHPKQGNALALGVVGASTVLFLRVWMTTAALNPRLALVVGPYFLLPFSAGLAMTAAGLRWNKDDGEEGAPPANPLQFWTALQMAALFQAVFYLVYGLGQTFGREGVFASGAVLGLTDVDALTISMARGNHGAPGETAAYALSIGILSNTVLKAAVAATIGGGRFRWIAAGGLAVIAGALVLSFAILR
jgi:uncharacterized membrane protein (DUF4010 family)